MQIYAMMLDKSVIECLSPSEKFQLLEDVWDSLAVVPSSVPVSQAVKAELDVRHDAYRRAPESALSLDEFNNRLRQRV